MTTASARINRSRFQPAACYLAMAATGSARWCGRLISAAFWIINAVTGTVLATRVLPGGNAPPVPREENYHATAFGTSAHSQHNR